MDSVKIDELEKVLRQREKFDYSTQPIEFLWGYDSTLIKAVPKLITCIRELETKNQTLQKQVQELEKALIKLVKMEVRLPECAVCWERGQCTDRSHGDNCLAIGYIVDTAKEAAKENK